MLFLMTLISIMQMEIMTTTMMMTTYLQHTEKSGTLAILQLTHAPAGPRGPSDGDGYDDADDNDDDNGDDYNV